jgi:hypothetical protein
MGKMVSVIALDGEHPARDSAGACQHSVRTWVLKVHVEGMRVGVGVEEGMWSCA